MTHTRSIDTLKVFEKLQHAEMYFKGTIYDSDLQKAIDLYYDGKMEEALVALGKLPDGVELLGRIVNELKDKPVYKTLKKIQLGHVQSEVEKMKGFSSLLTRLCIEVENGKREYVLLMEEVTHRLLEGMYLIKKECEAHLLNHEERIA